MRAERSAVHVYSSTVRPGDVIADRFVVESLAGTGGMGEVYRARDQQTGETVAVKLLGDAAQASAERFAREGKVLADLRHPAIVRYIAHGSSERGPFLAMQWLEGEDLAERLARGRLTVAETVTLGIRVADALAFAHGRGVIHRDLKPSNLFLPGGAIERVTLLDFGVARWHGGTHAVTRTGMLMGTPGYMAPEQARGRTVDARADTFSLGCVLFECLAGQPAFAGEHLMALLAKILLGEPPRLRERRPDTPTQLEALVARMMAKAPDERPVDIGLVATELASLDAPDSQSDPDSATAATALQSFRSHSLSHDEHRLLCVVVASSRPTTGLDATFVAESIEPGAVVRRLQQSIDCSHIAIDAMVDGSIVAVVSGHSIAKDLARQAARCALVLSELLPRHVVSVATGRGLLSGRRPVGEVLDRAARAVASPRDGVALDELTADLLGDEFDVNREGGELALRGERADADEPHVLLGRPSPFVGREHELRTLGALVGQCIDESVAQVVVIKAGAGVGKSRLCAELVRQIRARDDAPRILTAHGDPAAPKSPYATLRDLLRPVAPASEDVASTAVDVLSASCAEQPLVVVLDDLQWVDVETVNVLDAALRELTDRPFMVFAFGRPELEDAFPRLWVDRGVTEIRLGDLPRKASEKFVKQALGPDTPPDILTTLVERSQGNALVLEQLVRAEGEGRRGAVPNIVLAIVQARVEALDPTLRRVLRAASVYGDSFTHAGVRALLGDEEDAEGLRECLAALVEEEMLAIRERSTSEGDVRYAFSHALMRDAVHATLTESDHKVGHALASLWLARGGGDSRSGQR